jgi:hypothetical protein
MADLNLKKFHDKDTLITYKVALFSWLGIKFRSVSLAENQFCVVLMS